ncbi:MAG: hypothetical protein HYW05_00580 [Candidatus Diapherotrites archaeon]|nr:hypothetical protein [Candidatus Diapherotrites archaeon]
MIKESLEQAGLSKNETKVYVALLPLGSATAGELISKAAIPRSKIYVVLDRLIEKGLASFVAKGKTRYFQASPPYHLKEILEKKEEAIKIQKQEIEKIIPKLVEMQKTGYEEQKATLFEGIKGVKAAVTDIINTLRKGNSYDVFTMGEELEKEDVMLFFRWYHTQRAKKGIGVRLITNKNVSRVMRKYHMYPLMKLRISEQIMPTGIFIYADKVLTLIWGEKPIAVIIKSKLLNQRYREFFENMWAVARAQ